MSERLTQGEAILRVLSNHEGEWVPLYDIIGALGDGRIIGQYNARILELREEGYVIINKKDHVNGRVLSWYKLIRPRRQTEMQLSG